MHYNPEAAEMLIQFNNGLSKFFDGFEDKEAVINVERCIEVERRSFGGGVLANESSFGCAEVSVFIFREMGEVDRLRA